MIETAEVVAAATFVVEEILKIVAAHASGALTKEEALNQIAAHAALVAKNRASEDAEVAAKFDTHGG